MLIGRGCVPSLLFDLRPNYGGGNEDNGDLLQMVLCTHCRTRCPRPCSRPLTHASARDAWTLTGEPGSVSRGVTAPVSWVLVHTRFCLCHQESVSQSCVSSGGSVVGLMTTSSKRSMAYAITKSAAPRAPASAAVVACCRIGGMNCSSTCTGSFERGHHYLHYLHHSFAPGK